MTTVPARASRQLGATSLTMGRDAWWLEDGGDWWFKHDIGSTAQWVRLDESRVPPAVRETMERAFTVLTLVDEKSMEIDVPLLGGTNK